jgi:hypothetical protein
MRTFAAPPWRRRKGLGFATPPPQGETDPLAVLMVLLYHNHPLDADRKRGDFRSIDMRHTRHRG